ncbi:serine hydrolase [Nonomuraea angiospora]|uniref:serine hydrolase n=1 Tax=Nonomuraea angiospora TaxID=46172 RepID=UPI00332F3BD6
MKTGFDAVRDTFAEALGNGDEVGAAIALDVDGETVIDLWGGHRDPERTSPWTSDTIVNVFSTTKIVTALAVLVLADRGTIDLDAPVATYWPEFAANGKDGILVRHILGHTSGVSGWEQPITIADVYDLPISTARLAGQAPWWTPGTAAGYHAVTQGHLLGEIIRRVDGRSLTRFVAEELAAPLRADVQIGAREPDWHRIAPVIPPPPVRTRHTLRVQPATNASTHVRRGDQENPQTRTDHLREITAYPGWRTADELEWKGLEEHLFSRAMEHDSPRLR